LVTRGLFGLTRNPIYLGDAFVLCAAAVWWDNALGFLVVAGFVWIITQRFIKVEESRLIAAFGDQAQEWFRQVRRWV
jgi:protein-S-isoprenylcysteine O-methyltransferase Ste14